MEACAGQYTSWHCECPQANGKEFIVPRVKRPNAQKHGVFGKVNILPGEDPREFAQLFAALVEEWAPDGPTEEDATLSLAKCMWRKARLQKFLMGAVLENRINPNHPAYDEVFVLIGFAHILKTQPENGFELNANKCLRKDRIEYFYKKLPRTNFKSNSEWSQALINDIEAILVPELTINPDASNTLSLNQASWTVREDIFEMEVALEERLDTMIERAIKRLVQTKMMKQMMCKSSTERGNHQLTRPQNNKTHGSGKVVKLDGSR
jgi:hypothetical protein